MKQAIVIRHVPFEDLGNLRETLDRQGYAVTYIEAATGCLEKIDPLEPNLLVVLGGPIGVYDEEDYPFIQQELSLLKKRLAADLPTLGICLGAQLMARALGAQVYPGSEKEIGWSPISLSDAGHQSPLSYLGPEHTAVLHWHGDTFDLPPGAIHLASSSKYRNQAFAWKECGLALQFHPEVTAGGLEHWFIGHACEISSTPGIDIAQLREDTARYAERLQVQASKLWQTWLEKVAVSEEINRSAASKINSAGASSSQPGYGFEELRYLKRTIMFNELDKRYLRMASEVLRDRADALLSEWYQYLCSHADLKSYFQPEGQSQTAVKEAVRQRFGQWLADTCMGDYDLEWFDRQQQMGLGYLPPCARHPMPHALAIASIAPFTNILKQFLASIDYNSEAVDHMHQALFKSILLQVAFSQITALRALR